MTRLEYLEILEQKLKKSMSQKEVNDIVRDYAEYFEDGKSQGKGDEEIAAKLGYPEDVAKQILEENNIDACKKSVGERSSEFFSSFKGGCKKFFSALKNMCKKLFGSMGRGFKNVFRGTSNCIKKLNIPTIFKYILLIIIGIPLAIIAGIIAVCLIIALLCVLGGLILIGAAFFIPAILLMLASGFTIEFFPAAVPALIIIMGIGSLALGLCLICLAFVICQDIKRAIFKKRIRKNVAVEEKDPCEELQSPDIDFDNYCETTNEENENSEKSEGSEDND